MNGTERFPIGCRVVLARPVSPHLWERGMTGIVTEHAGPGVRVKLDRLRHPHRSGWFKYPEELDRAYPVVKLPPMSDAEWNERRERVRKRYVAHARQGEARGERFMRGARFVSQFPRRDRVLFYRDFL